VAKAAKKATGKKRTGRPSAFKPEYVKLAERFCLLGATDKDLAAAFGVSEVTINAWKKLHPEFLKSLKAGKEEADAAVANSLYRRALGYSHRAVKILTVAQGNHMGSTVEEVPYIERYPPDTTAAIFWLKNRRPDLWRDKQDLEHTGKDGGPLEIAVTHIVVDASAT